MRRTKLGHFSTSGFLNANLDGDSKHASNFGILDQIAALHWIQENIVHFGGDPKRVTLMGHGTGASCVNFLMTSEALPKGLLFQRVILMSGMGIAPWSLVQDPRTTTKALMTSLNCSVSKGSGEGLNCLRSKSLQALLSEGPSGLDGPAPRFRPRWGPSHDSIVVHSFQNDVRTYLERMVSYDLLFGISTGDAINFLNERQLQYGMSMQERNKVSNESLIKQLMKSLTLLTLSSSLTLWLKPILGTSARSLPPSSPSTPTGRAR